MSSQADNPISQPTIIVEALAAEGRDIADIRAQKRSLLKQLESGSGGDKELTPEELLAQWPTDPKTDRDAASLIFQDFCRRRRHDSTTNYQEYEERFPEHKEALASLARQEEFHKSLSGSEGTSPHFALPDVGDQLFGFRLVHQLGCGSFARVFLALQDNLASRPVVLKVSDIEGDEPQTMAMLQHTHIVPIYSVHEDQKAGLRVVCMPYFGGASLSAVLKQAGVGRVTVHSGTQLVQALQAVQAPIPPNEPRAAGTTFGDPKVLALLRNCSYPQAAAWITARLAEGLQHSHSRGVLHRDLKPANVLLGMDGQPMLLDFNLAQVTRGEHVRIVLGGTFNYMAPEHLRSLASHDLSLARQVDHRADIFSLGMVLFEMLVGRGPFAESASYTALPLLVEAMAVERSKGAPSLRQALPDAPWDLESILRKCLAPSPENRYQQAEDLAEDLQRFLDDRPLRYASQLSLRDRCRKWRRRHPRLAIASSVGAVAVLLVSTLGTALIGSRHLLAETQSQLGATQEHLERARAQQCQRDFRAGTIRALCLVNTSMDGQDQLPAGRQECEKVLGLYQVLERDDWQEQSAWRTLEQAQRQQLAEDVRELLLQLASARVAATPGDAATLHDALSLLDRCETVAELPPLRALWEDRSVYLEQLGQAEQAQAARAKAAALTPASPRDHYLLATSFARVGRDAETIAELNTALRLKPDHYWSLVQRGICYREQDQLLLATADFSRCADLEPDLAWGHYNLGWVFDQGKKREQAIACYTTALRCDSGFALAYLNRGLALLDLKQAPAALEDLDQAARLGRDDVLLHLGRGTVLDALGQAAPARSAFARAFDRIPALPPARQAALLLRYGLAGSRHLPDAVDQALAELLRRQPHDPKALYARAMVLVEREREGEALACFNEALDWHPAFVDARRFRAVLLARKGQLAAAQEDINRCLSQEPEAGITLYAAACVLARAATLAPDADVRQQREDQALAFLKKAFQHGYGHEGAAADPDLRALHQRPEAQALWRGKTP